MRGQGLELPVPLFSDETLELPRREGRLAFWPGVSENDRVGVTAGTALT